MKVPANAGGVVSSAQWVLQALDQVTEVVEGLEDLCTLVEHWQVHCWFMMEDRLIAKRVFSWRWAKKKKSAVD